MDMEEISFLDFVCLAELVASKLVPINRALP
jgi:hypothetical protein